MPDNNTLKHNTYFINNLHKELNINSVEDTILESTYSILKKNKNVLSTRSHECNFEQKTKINDFQKDLCLKETDHSNSNNLSYHFSNTIKDANNPEKYSSEPSLHYEQFFMLCAASEDEDWVIMDFVEKYEPANEIKTKATQTNWEDNNTYKEVIHDLVLKKFNNTLERFKNRSFKRKQRRWHTSDFGHLQNCSNESVEIPELRESLESQKHTSLEPKCETLTTDIQNSKEYKYSSKQSSENASGECSSSTPNVSIKICNKRVN